MTRALVPIVLLALFPGCSAPGSDEAADPIHDGDSAPVMLTRWGREVNPASPLPEHPRPTLVRESWRSLNGTWQFEPGFPGQQVPRGRDLEGEILVPFPMESALSGVGEHHAHSWYRHRFEVPETWSRDRVLIHFGAVDWEAEVWINGVQYPAHRGGYEPFSLDITGALLPGLREQEVTVRVFDPTDAGEQPRGRQAVQPGAQEHRSVSGIWQTVWIEAVPRRGIDELDVSPDPERGGVMVTALGVDSLGEDSVEIEVLERGGLLGIRKGPVGEPLFVPITAPRTWSPQDPFLYDLRVTRTAPDGLVRDRVSTYFALRTVEVRPDESGVSRVHLNGESLFLQGVHDPGIWPDGLYTAPSDEAMRHDVAMARELGFNLIRKRDKVEPERWYMWCDRLGVLVWQDMPAASNETEKGRSGFEAELTGVLRTVGRHPSVIQWIVFDGGRGEYEVERLTRRVEQLDPTRLVTSTSGGEDPGGGDAVDVHSVPDPVAPAVFDGRLAVVGEYGGLSLPIEGHVWGETPTDGEADQQEEPEAEEPEAGEPQVEEPETGDPEGGGLDPGGLDAEALAFTYEVYSRDLARMKSEGLAAAVYAQLSDVEGQTRGLMTYDREVVKVEPARLARANRGDLPALVTILPTSEGAGGSWQYCLDAPGKDWKGEYGAQLDLPDTEDEAWDDALGAFGAEGSRSSEHPPRTLWDTPDLWLRSEFRVGSLAEGELLVRLHHAARVEVWVNGDLVLDREGSTEAYTYFRTGLEAAEVLRPGANLIAVHASRLEDAQHLDVGLSVLSSE